MLRSIGVAAVSLCAALSFGAAHADSVRTNKTTASETENWNVAFQNAHATAACTLTARFQDGSSFELKVFGDRNVMIARYAKKGWGSTRMGDASILGARFEGAKPFAISTEAYSFERGVIFMVDSGFVERMAQSDAIRLNRGDALEPGVIDLTKAPGALEELARCVAARFAQTRAAKNFQSIGWFPPSG